MPFVPGWATILPPMRRSLLALLILIPAAAPGARASDFAPREFNVGLSGGKSPSNFHGHSVWRSIHFEVVGDSPFVSRWIRRASAGASISYSDIHQARSWFGYRYGDPDDWVRAVSTYFFVRKPWRDGRDLQPYVELGTGPMWSNRRVPAATSRFNMDSQLGFGAVLFAHAHTPLRLGYRFSHISNGGLTGRNPGLNVHSIVIGARVFTRR